jgi:hypothetical protein
MRNKILVRTLYRLKFSITPTTSETSETKCPRKRNSRKRFEMIECLCSINTQKIISPGQPAARQKKRSKSPIKFICSFWPTSFHPPVFSHLFSPTLFHPKSGWHKIVTPWAKLDMNAFSHTVWLQWVKFAFSLTIWVKMAFSPTKWMKIRERFCWWHTHTRTLKYPSTAMQIYTAKKWCIQFVFVKTEVIA